MSMDETLASFFETTPTPLAVLDRTGTFQHMNGAWKGILDAATTIGKRLDDVLAPKDAARAREALQGLAPGRSQVFDAQVSSAGDSVVRMRLCISREPATERVHLVAMTTLATDAADAANAERKTIMTRVFQRVLETAPVIMWAMDRDGICTISEGKGLEVLGLKANQLVGQNLFELYKDNPEIASTIVRPLSGEELRTVSELAPGVFLDGWNMPLRGDSEGHVEGVIGFAMDASERVKSVQELRAKLDLIERQSETIRALATPIIQIWDEILCLPVIGIVDSARTADMMQALLDAIVREQARFAIVDLTGVEIVDTSTADHLIKLFRAAKVLGVDGVVSGIRPAVAQTVVALGLDLASVRMMRSLRDALKWCIRVRSRDHRREDTEVGPANGSPHP